VIRRIATSMNEGEGCFRDDDRTERKASAKRLRSTSSNIRFASYVAFADPRRDLLCYQRTQLTNVRFRTVLTVFTDDLFSCILRCWISSEA
jgi:hypothetical protein